MTILQTIHHKKNEIQAEEFYEDKECTQDFDFTNAKNLYVEFKGGNCTPLLFLPYGYEYYIPYIPVNIDDTYLQEAVRGNITTLDDITPNLSKYIPEDNAVLFLSEFYSNQSKKLYKDLQKTHKVISSQTWYNKYTYWEEYHKNDFSFIESLKDTDNFYEKLTIFLSHGTQSEFEKAKEVAKELMEKYGVEEVNLLALHWFGSKYEVNAFEIEYLCESFGILSNINKIITTNSTGILKLEDSTERLQVIDCKEIFEEYLNENNLI